ncbi:hypothetical protein GCM10023201_38900 [Actinomycetospora corticicola]
MLLGAAVDPGAATGADDGTGTDPASGTDPQPTSSTPARTTPATPVTRPACPPPAPMTRDRNPNGEVRSAPVSTFPCLGTEKYSQAEGT